MQFIKHSPTVLGIKKIVYNEVYSVFSLIWRLNVEEKLQFLRFHRPVRLNITYKRSLVTVVKLFTNSHQCKFRSFSCAV